MGYFPPEFLPFIQSGSDRFASLTAYLRFKNIPFSVISLENGSHVLVNFPSSAYNPLFKVKTVLAHYDCCENTCGANDNAAAVYQVASLAERLLASGKAHNMRILFTAGEELGAEEGVTGQGAFAVATCFKKLGITNDDVYVLDCCGRGDVLVISTAGKRCGTPQFKDRFDDLFERLADLARQVSPRKWVTFPVPYGDNAGFMAAGIPAVALTVLPQDEATAFMRSLQRDKTLEDGILNRKPFNRELLPLTWRMIHSSFDTEPGLTSDAFALMERFLDALAVNKTLA